MRQIEHQLVLAVLGEIPALHGLLQLAAGQIQVGGNIPELILRGDDDPAAEITFGQLADLLRDFPEIAGVRLCKQIEEDKGQRDKKDQKKIQVPNVTDKIPEPGQRVLGQYVSCIILLQHLVQRIGQDAGAEHAQCEQENHLEAEAAKPSSH
ncbi:hypothetical protein D3C80_1638690 [compost metagenome]